MLTKQDLQTIITLISKQSVKDTQFPAASAITADNNTQIPVVQSGKNKLLKLNLLVKYVNSNTDLASMPIDMGWSDKKTLGELLSELYEFATSITYVDENRNPLPFTAEYVGYTRTGTSYQKVKDALDGILDILDSLDDLGNNLPGKADLEEGTSVLKQAQWPTVVVIGLLTASEHLATEVGDVYRDFSDNHLWMVAGKDENQNPVLVDMGSFNSNVIYCDKNTSTLYRWDPSAGNNGDFISVGGGDSITIIDDIVENNKEAVTSGAVAAALAGLDERIDALEDAANPIKRLFTVTPSLIAYTGENTEVTFSASVKRGAVPVEGCTIVFDIDTGLSDTNNNVSSAEWITTVRDRNGAGYVAQAHFTINTVKYTEVRRIKVMHKFRMGFSTAAASGDLDVTSLQFSTLNESFPSEVSNLKNPPIGSGAGDYYLWVAYDSYLGDSITIKSDGFTVDMADKMPAKDGYCLWRSKGPVEFGTHSYTISK